MTVPRGYRKARSVDGLTDRERDVLLCLASGAQSGVEVAARLRLTKQRVWQVMQRLDELGCIVRRGHAVYVLSTRIPKPPPRRQRVNIAKLERELAYEAASNPARVLTVEQAIAALVRAGVVSVAELNERQ